MTHQEICEKLFELGFETGWAVRDEKIVLWENEQVVPKELKKFVQLDNNNE